MPKPRRTVVSTSGPIKRNVFVDLVGEVLEELKDITEDTAEELFDEIVRRTPVDTGRAKEGWELYKDPRGNIQIINDVDYIIYLEEGSSNQAPSGMVRTSIAKVIK